jgi:hypothetical protein
MKTCMKWKLKYPQARTCRVKLCYLVVLGRAVTVTMVTYPPYRRGVGS